MYYPNLWCNKGCTVALKNLEEMHQPSATQTESYSLTGWSAVVHSQLTAASASQDEVILPQMRFCHIAQAGLRLLDSSNPPALASLRDGTTGCKYNLLVKQQRIAPTRVHSALARGLRGSVRRSGAGRAGPETPPRSRTGRTLPWARPRGGVRPPGGGGCTRRALAASLAPRPDRPGEEQHWDPARLGIPQGRRVRPPAARPPQRARHPPRGAVSRCLSSGFPQRNFGHQGHFL
ncbi:hypothetical protein AAY473_016647 [Plecturocebus cupreus]